ncbi:MAG: methyl-accepting chemotaxis protein [Ktedonobacteraceae bacterium]
MFKIANTPIFRRLFIAFTLAAVVPGIVIAVLGSTYINTLTVRGQAEQTSIETIKITSTQLANLRQMNADLIAYHSTVYADRVGSATNATNMVKLEQLLKNEINTLQGNFNQVATQYQRDYQLASSPNMAGIEGILLANNPDDKTAVDQQQTLDKVLGSGQEWPKYQAAQSKELLGIKSHVSHALSHQELFQAYALFQPLLADWQHIVDLTQNVGNQVASVGTAQTNTILLASVIAFLCTVLLVAIIGYVVNLTITRPLRQLATLTRRIARGNTGARAEVAGRDEISLVASSMNNMLDNIVRLIQEVQFQRDNLQGQVEKLVSEVSGVGEGDLRVQAEVTADALGVLADSFNYMVEELGSLVVRVKMVAHEVESSTVAIFDRLTQLVETGDMQLNQISEAALEVERMGDSSRQVADRANILYNVARDAQQSAEGGREAVQQAVEGMGRIHENVQATSSKVQTLGERSREINNIVEAISSIAHQTNRLALDAAIQAAMAGENGKGFGAVAADIRRLAERAKDQASMITRIVRSVREDIGAAAVSMQDTERETSAGAKMTEEAGVALESIFTAVERQAQEIETINQMAIQQLQSSSAVEQIMRGVSESTQQSTRSTREASHNMERLARLVEQLRASVEAFKLRENQDYYIPSSNVNVTPVNEQENQMTVSGFFRTVTSTAQPTGMGAQNALPPARATDPFSFYPITPGQQGAPWNGQVQPEQPRRREPLNEGANNGKRNR